MHPFEFRRRLASHNVLHPYRWTARYADGSVLEQYGPTGVRRSCDVDLSRLEAVELVGHPDSPLKLERPYRDRPPDEFVVRATTDISITTAGSERSISRTVRRFIGYRYGKEHFLLEIDDAGRVYKTNRLA